MCVTLFPIHTLSGFMLNFCAVMLELCKPFFSNDPSGQKLALINAQYATSPACRLDLHNETCLAQGIVGEYSNLAVPRLLLLRENQFVLNGVAKESMGFRAPWRPI